MYCSELMERLLLSCSAPSIWNITGLIPVLISQSTTKHFSSNPFSSLIKYLFPSGRTKRDGWLVGWLAIYLFDQVNINALHCGKHNYFLRRPTINSPEKIIMRVIKVSLCVNVRHSLIILRPKCTFIKLHSESCHPAHHCFRRYLYRYSIDLIGFQYQYNRSIANTIWLDNSLTLVKVRFLILIKLSFIFLPSPDIKGMCLDIFILLELK